MVSNNFFGSFSRRKRKKCAISPRFIIKFSCWPLWGHLNVRLHRNQITCLHLLHNVHCWILGFYFVSKNWFTLKLASLFWRSIKCYAKSLLSLRKNCGKPKRSFVLHRHLFSFFFLLNWKLKSVSVRWSCFSQRDGWKRTHVLVNFQITLPVSHIVSYLFSIYLSLSLYSIHYHFLFYVRSFFKKFKFILADMKIYTCWMKKKETANEKNFILFYTHGTSMRFFPCTSFEATTTTKKSVKRREYK